MTTLNGKTRVSLDPKHLKSLRFHLCQYLGLLCDQAKEGEKAKEINELAFLWLAIDTSLETHCDDNAEHVGLQIIDLEARVADLEAKLANRPVVWMLRDKSSGLLIKTGHHPDIYVLEHANQFNPASYTIEPYNRGAR